MKRKSLSRARLFATPWTIQSMEFSRLEYWSGLDLPSPRGSSQPRDRTQVSRIAGGFSYQLSQRKVQGILKWVGVGSLSLLQQIFPTQEWSRGLLHCRRFLYQLSCKGRPSRREAWGNYSSFHAVLGYGVRHGLRRGFYWTSMFDNRYSPSAG